MPPSVIAAQLIARCSAGFTNEFQHANWLKKHQAEIAGLPEVLHEPVLLAHKMATVKEFSK